MGFYNGNKRSGWHDEFEGESYSPTPEEEIRWEKGNAFSDAILGAFFIILIVVILVFW